MGTAAWSQGWETGSRIAEEGNARKAALKDEDRRQQAADLIDTKHDILSHLPALKGPNGEETPEYKEAYDKLNQTQYNLGQLYHPDKAPGALQQDWHYLLDKMHNIKPPKKADAQESHHVAPAAASIQPPPGATEFMAVAKPDGLVESGNLPIWNRPTVANGDGTHSSEYSTSFQDDKGNEVLVPTVVNGKFLTPDGKKPAGGSAQEKAMFDAAWKHYEQTGENLGKFSSSKDADAYAQVLHNRGTPSAHGDADPGKSQKPSWGQAQLFKKQAASMQKAQQQVAAMASANPLSPGQQAMRDYDNSEAVRQKQMDDALATAKRLGLSDTDVEELKRSFLKLKGASFKPLPGADGQARLGPDGKTYVQYGTDANGNPTVRPVAAGFQKKIKPIAGTIINTKAHGWIKTWVDGEHPSVIVGWQKTSPGSRYAGTAGSSSSTDPYGVTTTTSRGSVPASGSAPVDVDLSGAQSLPENYNGEEISDAPRSGAQPPSATPQGVTPPSGSPNKSPAPSAAPPASVAKKSTGAPATPKQLKAQIPAPPPDAPASTSSGFPVDADGHIPDADIQKRGLNKNLVQIANNLMDGTSIKDVNTHDRGAAEALAKQYGWGGQGMFSPRETLQIKEGASFLNKMANSPSLKVLDGGFFSNLPMTGASTDPTKEGFFGRMGASMSAHAQSPQQQEFMRLYRQLDAMAIGLRSLVQSGRGTQKQTDLLISELPNPINTPSSKDAKERLKLVQQELDIAAKTGHLRGVEDMQKSFDSVGAHQHKEGDTVMLNGQRVKIKKIYPDGTFDY